MKNVLMFVVPIVIGICLMFSCSPQEEQVPFIMIDTTKVYLNTEPDPVFIKETKTDTLSSEITCPKCNFKKTEIMPTDVCLLKYTCKGCFTELLPKEGDCCVFCTYGDHKCPSMQ